MGDVDRIGSEPFEARGHASADIAGVLGRLATWELQSVGPGGTVIESIQSSASQIGADSKLIIRLADTPAIATEPDAVEAVVTNLGGVMARSRFWGMSNPNAFIDPSVNNVRVVSSFPFGQGQLAIAQRRIFVPPAAFFALQLNDVAAPANVAFTWREVPEPV